MRNNIDTENKIVPDFRLVAVDETEYYSIPSELSEIKKIYGVYLVDFNSHTYCCELTPSLWLDHLYNTFTVDDSVNDCELLEEIDSWLREVEGSSFYAHVSFVEKDYRFSIIESYPFTEQQIKDYLSGEVVYGELEEEVREYYQGNSCF